MAHFYHPLQLRFVLLNFHFDLLVVQSITNYVPSVNAIFCVKIVEIGVYCCFCFETNLHRDFLLCHQRLAIKIRWVPMTHLDDSLHLRFIQAPLVLPVNIILCINIFNIESHC